MKGEAPKFCLQSYTLQQLETLDFGVSVGHVAVNQSGVGRTNMHVARVNPRSVRPWQLSIKSGSDAKVYGP